MGYKGMVRIEFTGNTQYQFMALAIIVVAFGVFICRAVFNGKSRPKYLALAAIALALGVFVCQAVFSEYYTYQKLQLPAQKKLIISGASSWEYSQDLYYQIQDRSGLTERRLFGFAQNDSSDLKLGSVFADGGSVVGIVDEYRPDVLLILLDSNHSRSREEMAGIIRDETKQNYILPEDIGTQEKLPRVMWSD
jgi:hypothetical protein